MVEAFPSTPIYRSLGALNRASRSSFDWRGLASAQSTAEQIAQKLGIPVPQWAKAGYHWSQILRPGASLQKRSRLGQVSTQQISAIASTGASATVGILVAMGTIAGPVGAAIGGLIGVGQLLVGVFKGCGQTCVEATSIVNQVEPVLAQNLETYVASPVRTVSMQAAAINNFETAWNAVVQNCNNPQLLSAGQNCIKDREQGSCAYKTSPGGWQQSNGVYTYQYPGANGSGSACWNWFIGYHDPIANDPDVQPDTAATGSTSTTSTAATSSDTASTPSTALTSSSGPDLLPLLLLGGALLILATI